jgi:adenylate cyclase
MLSGTGKPFERGQARRGGSALFRPVVALVRRWPFVSFFVLAVFSNLWGSSFNISYNYCLIVENYLRRPAQQDAWDLLLILYNALAYPSCLLLMLYLLWPLARCLRDLRAGVPVAPARLERCRRLLVNLPWYQVCVNLLGWAPGALVFPLGICLLGGWDNAGPIWLHFFISFLVSALLTTVQTFFFLEAFLVEVIYPEFFRDARPAEVLGTLRVPLGWRLFLYWLAVGVVPLVALLAVALNFIPGHVDKFPLLRQLALGTAICGLLTSGVISWMVGRNLVSWVLAHAEATGQITLGRYDYRIREKRPDEFGQLTDGFNDMAAALERARYVRQRFGQFFRPDVRDEILEYEGLGGEVQEITVVFLDIRGFTRRSAGEPPEQVVALLNRFFSLAVAAIEAHGGWVDKFLGDGVMALFGAPRARRDHADRAVRAMREVVSGLGRLNKELSAQGQAPLAVGAGIHTGAALVGCIGATLPRPDGRDDMHCTFTAIGETVNLAQRLEQLTKECGGPILLSEQTRQRLREQVPLKCLGPRQVPGFACPVVIYRVDEPAVADAV